MQEAEARAVLGLSSGARDSEIAAAYRARVADLRERLYQAPDSRTRNGLEQELAALKEAHETLLSNVTNPGGAPVPDDSGRPTNNEISAQVPPIAPHKDAFPTVAESVDSGKTADDTELSSDPVFRPGQVGHRLSDSESEAGMDTIFDPVDRSSSSAHSTRSESEPISSIAPGFPSSPPPLPSEFSQPVQQDSDSSAQSWQPPTVPNPAPPTQRSPVVRKGWHSPWLLLAIGGLVFCLVCVLAAIWWLLHSDERTVSGKDLAHPSPSIQKSTPFPAPSATPVTTATPVAKPTPIATAAPASTQTPAATATATPASTQTPAATATPLATQTPSATQTSSTSKASPSVTALTKSEIDATKAEVIKRINAVPEYTAEQKALLIQKLGQARSMERITVVRFGAGETNLQRASADELVKIFNTPAMQSKLADKTVILIVAGYADTGGRAETNLTLSRERAEAVATVLRFRLKLTNAVQTIGMGGTELLSNERPDQNRAVEVWAVSPI